METLSLQGMAMDMLGSQANENVLVEQPEAFITQKARVKRNRRTEWDYYVQFAGFSEDEGAWYSARAIKTQHPRGAELIREFEHPDDDVADITPTPAPAHQRQSPKPATVPFTQDTGPSQMHPVHEPYAHSQHHQPHTQEQFASQMQQPADPKLVASSAATPGFQVHGQHQSFDPDMLNTASQRDLQPPLHWSFDRLQRPSPSNAPPYNAQQLLQRDFAIRQAQASGLPVHSRPAPAAAASMPPREASMAHQMPAPKFPQPLWGQHAQGSWVPRPQWQQPALSIIYSSG